MKSGIHSFRPLFFHICRLASEKFAKTTRTKVHIFLFILSIFFIHARVRQLKMTTFYAECLDIKNCRLFEFLGYLLRFMR